MFFTYRQNNSGGKFEGPSIVLVIESDDVLDANKIAEEYGVYFDGVMDDIDCSCCGDRWSYPSSYHQQEECYMFFPKPTGSYKWYDSEDTPYGQFILKSGEVVPVRLMDEESLTDLLSQDPRFSVKDLEGERYLYLEV